MKKLDVNFLKSLIETDFSLLFSSKASSRRLDLRYMNSALVASNSLNSTFSLEVLELVKSLKQTIRLLQFIKDKNANRVLICTVNKQHLNLLNLYLKDLSISNSIEVKNRLTKTKLKGEFSQLLILLEEPLGNNTKVFKKLFEDKIYLINKINSKLEANNWYTYKIYNDLADFKKLIFLIVLLKQVL